jgi:hypothetical protein
MYARGDDNLVAVLEQMREWLRHSESSLPQLREETLELRLHVDREIENLRCGTAPASLSLIPQEGGFPVTYRQLDQKRGVLAQFNRLKGDN